jgi:putative addiction module component (TIGR02574 family)
MNRISAGDFLRLSVPERIQLVEDIWDSIAEVPDSVPLTQEQTEELEQRLDSYHKNPDNGSPWEFAKQKIKNTK